MQLIPTYMSKDEFLVIGGGMGRTRCVASLIFL
jgi:hypothetical protein